MMTSFSGGHFCTDRGIAKLSGSISGSSDPIERAPLRVRHGKDEYLIVMHLKRDEIWESIEDSPANRER
jgi:hypothetical protein